MGLVTPSPEVHVSCLLRLVGLVITLRVQGSTSLVYSTVLRLVGLVITLRVQRSTSLVSSTGLRPVGLIITLRPRLLSPAQASLWIWSSLSESRDPCLLSPAQAFGLWVCSSLSESRGPRLLSPAQAFGSWVGSSLSESRGCSLHKIYARVKVTCLPNTIKGVSTAEGGRGYVTQHQSTNSPKSVKSYK